MNESLVNFKFLLNTCINCLKWSVACPLQCTLFPSQHHVLYWSTIYTCQMMLQSRAFLGRRFPSPSCMLAYKKLTHTFPTHSRLVGIQSFSSRLVDNQGYNLIITVARRNELKQRYFCMSKCSELC